MLYLILLTAFFAFKYFGFPALTCVRYACLVAVAGFLIFIGQPLYRMKILGERPGQAIANSKTVPRAAQFFIYLNGRNLIYDQGMKGYCGPCVHYSHYQQKLMDLFGVPSTAITGYGHSALQFTEGGRVYMTDNGYWYKKIVECGSGDWSPEGPERYYEVKGSPNPLSPYLFPIAMFGFILLSYPLELVLSDKNRSRVPFRSSGKIRTVPDFTEYRYRRARGRVAVAKGTGDVLLDPSEVEQLKDAPDMYFHRELGHFQFVYG